MTGSLFRVFAGSERFARVAGSGRFALAVAVAVVALAGLAVSPTGAAPVAVGARSQHGTAVRCGAVISVSTRLADDLDCAGPAFRVVGSAVTIDLAGHRVRSRASCALPCGIVFDTGSAGSTLTRGRVEGGGILISSANVSLTDLSIRAADVLMLGPGDQVLRGNLRGGSIAITNSQQAVRETRIRGGKGITSSNTSHALTDIAVTDNWVLGSEGDGIGFGPYFFQADDVTGEISRNVVWSSHGAGIRLSRNLQDVGAVSVADNWLVGNGGSGIDINGEAIGGIPFTGGPVTLTGNHAIANGAHGIDAGWLPGQPSGIVDGGGNQGYRNRGRDCLGVVCGSRRF